MFDKPAKKDIYMFITLFYIVFNEKIVSFPLISDWYSDLFMAKNNGVALLSLHNNARHIKHLHHGMKLSAEVLS